MIYNLITIFIDFYFVLNTDKLDLSEDKLFKLCENKKREVSEHVQKIIDHLRQLEDDLHSEIEEFKNNRLSYVNKKTNIKYLLFFFFIII